MTVQRDDDVAETIRRLAAEQHHSETDVVRDALAAYAQKSFPLPNGIGKYRSGCSDGSEKASQIGRDAAKERSALATMTKGNPSSRGEP